MSQPDRYDRDPPSTRRSRTTQRHIFADRRRESGDRNRGRATKLVTRRRQQKFVSEVAPPSFPLYLPIYLDRRRTFTVGVSDGLRRNANFYSHAYIRHASDIIKDAAEGSLSVDALPLWREVPLVSLVSCETLINAPVWMVFLL